MKRNPIIGWVIVVIVAGLAYLTFFTNSERPRNSLNDILDYANQQNGTSPPTEVQIPPKQIPLTEYDNGYDWKQASWEAKDKLCKDIAARLGKHDRDYYDYVLIDFYHTGNPNSMKQSIGSVVEMADELEVYNFLQKRWDFYEERDHRYIPEKHDEAVFSDGSEKFGLSKTHVFDIFWKIDRIKLGLAQP